MNYPEDDNFAPNGEQPYEGDHDSFSRKDQAEQPSQFGEEQGNPDPTPDESPDFDFSRMEDDVAAFRRELDERPFVTAPAHIVEEENPAVRPSIQPSNRRRRRTSSVTGRLSATELGERLESIVQRAAPTFDFFIFSILCGLILGVGYILDAPAILLIGVLTAPLLAPWVGVALSAAAGESRFFGQSLGGILTAMVLVFGAGILAGFASRIFQPLTLSQAYYHARLWWPDLLMLVIGTLVLMITFIQSDEKPVVASLMVAYQFYLPASAAGFGIGAGVSGLWPEAGLVFLIHLALSLMIGLLLFFYMGFRPLAASGFVLTAGIIIVGLVVVSGFAGIGSLVNVRGDRASATPTIQSTATLKPDPTASLDNTPTTQPLLMVHETPSPTINPSPTVTRLAETPTTEVFGNPTLLPTPVYGKVQSVSGGVMVREVPGGKSITTVQNGYLVEILPDKPITLAGAVWIHVIIKTPIRDINGWVLLSLISTATPFGSP